MQIFVTHTRCSLEVPYLHGPVRTARDHLPLTVFKSGCCHFTRMTRQCNLEKQYRNTFNERQKRISLNLTRIFPSYFLPKLKEKVIIFCIRKTIVSACVYIYIYILVFSVALTFDLFKFIVAE